MGVSWLFSRRVSCLVAYSIWGTIRQGASRSGGDPGPVSPTPNNIVGGTLMPSRVPMFRSRWIMNSLGSEPIIT